MPDQKILIIFSHKISFKRFETPKMFDTPEKPMYPTCKHKSLTPLHHPPNLSICGSCGYKFYQKTAIIKPYHPSQPLLRHIPRFIDTQILDLFHSPSSPSPSPSSPSPNTPSPNPDPRHLFLDHLTKRSKIMKLNQECQYLSIYLWDYFYLKNSSKYFAQKKQCDIYNATTLLLAAKMREVDVKTPYASEIRKLKDNNFTKKDLKDAEIVVANFFEWNFLYFTVWDYVEHCVSVGVLFGSDC
jgi:hypothetical protein